MDAFVDEQSWDRLCTSPVSLAGWFAMLPSDQLVELPHLTEVITNGLIMYAKDV